MRAGLPVLLITNRPDELPPGTTHLLLVRNQRIIAQGTRRAVLEHPRPATKIFYAFVLLVLILVREASTEVEGHAEKATPRR